MYVPIDTGLLNPAIKAVGEVFRLMTKPEPSGSRSVLPVYKKCRNCGHHFTSNTPFGGCPRCGSRNVKKY